MIYGWNRSGKTTISRVFASLEKKCTYDHDKFKQYPESGEFEIQTNDRATVKNTDITHFKEVGQLFISTHNFQFFDLVKGWLSEKSMKDSSEFFMMENFTESDVRKAKIVAIDKTLRNYKSEYHFLFARLKEFPEEQDTEHGDFYTIGNMARRFFEIFADFKILTTGDQKWKYW